MNTLTRSPKQVALALYGAVLTGDLAAAQPLVADGFVLHVPGSHPLAGDHRGVEALVRFVEASRARTDTGEHIEVLDVLEGDGHAAVYCHVTATRAGRAALDNRTVHLLAVSGGQVTEAWFHNWDDVTVNEFWS